MDEVSSNNRLSAEPFEDLPIDLAQHSIRLWRFKKTKVEGCVYIEMKVFTENTRPPYVALSYQWGTSKNDQIIVVNGHLLSITENLKHFLDILIETKFRTGWFWADQISIDQSNVAERGHQVNHMGRIFIDSIEVFSCLGGDLLHGISDFDVFHITGGLSYQCGPRCGQPSDDEILALYEVLTRPYWSRLWIVQEIRLAEKVTFWCGKVCLKRHDLLKGHKWMMQNHGEVRWNVLAKQSMHGLQTGFVSMDSLLGGMVARGTSDLFTVMEDYWRKECADERDKIFGVQALVDPSQRLHVDYTRDMNSLVHEVLGITLGYTIPPSEFDISMSRDSPKWKHNQILDQITALYNNLCQRPSIHDPARALYWAYGVTTLSNCAYQHFSLRTFRQAAEREAKIDDESWENIWQAVVDHAELPKQKGLALALQFLSCRMVGNVRAIRWNGHGGNALMLLVDDMINDTAAKLGFQRTTGRFVNCWFHPEEGGFPDIAFERALGASRASGSQQWGWRW